MQRTVLDNGLRVLVRPAPAAPLAAVYLWLEAGVVDEGPGEEGAAHFLEHMLFKGTGRRGVGESAGVIEGLGGDLNAFTSHEETVVHATVEAEAFGEALEVLADMVRRCALDPAEHEREKQVVLEEIRGYDDDPDTVLEEAVLARLFPDHPYGRPILGTPGSVRGLTAAGLKSWHRRCYGPDRAILAVAGAVDPDEVVQAARAQLGDWVPVGERPPVPEPPQPRGGPLQLTRDFETLAVELAWRGPPLGHPDQPALDVLAGALGEGAAALLTTRLQHDEELVTDLWASAIGRRAAGSFSVGFQPRPDKAAEAIRLALAELGRVARRGVGGATLTRARDALLADLLFGEETVDGLAHDLAWYEARMGSPEARSRYKAAVAAVTPADLQRVARTWLDPRNCTVAALDPSLPPRRLQALVRKATAPRGAPQRPGPTRYVLDNGATLWVLPDESPVAAVQVVGLGGGLAEEPRTAGTARAWARMVTAGAGDLDATEFAEATDAAAGTLDGQSERSTLGLCATFPADNLLDGLELVGAALVEPWFDKQEWERVRDEMLDDLRTLRDRPADVASRLSWAGCFPGHPWRLPPDGTTASLDRIGPGRLKRWHRAHCTADNLVVAVAGGVEPAEVHEALAPWLLELPAGPWRPPTLSPPRPHRDGLRLARAGREQAHLQLAWPGLACTDPDRHALAVAAATMEGQGGRLFLSLRETRGLAYAVWSDARFGFQGGIFGLGLATDPARTDEALAALREEARRLVAETPDEDEVARYRRMLRGQSAMGLQRAMGRARDLAVGERLGVPWGHAAIRRALDAVTADDVARAVRRVLRHPPVVVRVEPVP